MTQLLKAGSRLKSAVGATEVIVVRAPKEDIELTCGGQPMVAGDAAVAGSAPGGAGGDDSEVLLLGKRYADEEAGLEVLCTKGGPGPVQVNGRTLMVKGAKPLPSSD
jgi:hypothetical protein